MKDRWRRTVACLAGLLGTMTAWADVQAQFESPLPGLAMGYIADDGHGQYAWLATRHREGGVAWSGDVEKACAAHGSLWMFDVPTPVVCGEARFSDEDGATYRIKGSHGVAASGLVLLSTRPLHSIAPLESDAPRPAGVDAVLPPNLRSVRHSAIFTLPGRTFYAVSSVITNYREPPEWTAATIVEWTAGKATRLGETGTMPSRIIENSDTPGPVAWVPGGCGVSATLVTLNPGLKAVATYDGPVECEGSEGIPEAIPGAIRCDRAGAGVDAVICSRDILVAVDRSVARSYGQQRDTHEGAARDAIVAAQKAWIRQRNACADPAVAARYTDGEVGCLATVMSERVEGLQGASHATSDR